jgi:hypothetical protein
LQAGLLEQAEESGVVVVLADLELEHHNLSQPEPNTRLPLGLVERYPVQLIKGQMAQVLLSLVAHHPLHLHPPELYLLAVEVAE